MAADLDDLIGTYKPFRLDGRTEDQFFADPLPESVTVELPRRVAVAIASRAYCEDRSVEYIAAKVLTQWADDKTREATEMFAAFADMGGSADKEPPAELAYQRQVMDSLLTAGIKARSQVASESGVADVVVYRADKPLVVIELKASFRKRREVLHASGQARAYAQALGAHHHILSAPTIEAELLDASPGTARIVPIAELVACIKEFLGEAHVVSIAERR